MRVSQVALPDFGRVAWPELARNGGGRCAARQDRLGLHLHDLGPMVSANAWAAKGAVACSGDRGLGCVGSGIAIAPRVLCLGGAFTKDPNHMINPAGLQARIEQVAITVLGARAMRFARGGGFHAARFRKSDPFPVQSRRGGSAMEKAFPGVGATTVGSHT